MQFQCQRPGAPEANGTLVSPRRRGAAGVLEAQDRAEVDEDLEPIENWHEGLPGFEERNGSEVEQDIEPKKKEWSEGLPGLDD